MHRKLLSITDRQKNASQNDRLSPLTHESSYNKIRCCGGLGTLAPAGGDHARE